MTTNGTANMTELETFLPHDGSNIKDGGKYKVTVVPKETNGDKAHWDPFKERKVEHPTTDCDTLTHLLKASLGTGILAMPYAFKMAGLSFGIFLTILVSLICTHCAYVLVKCAHELYRRTRVTMMAFADIGEVAFENGPEWGRKYAKLARASIIVGLFAAYFGTCSVYTVIISENFRKAASPYGFDQLSERWCIMALLIPLILLTYIPNIKALTPVSMIANIFMGTGLGITFYYLVWDLAKPSERAQIGDIYNMPIFFSITIFAMEAIGVVMPLENNMKTPQHFIGICGVLNRGMGGVTLVYIFLGFLGHLKYENPADSITLSLPDEDIAAQAVKVLVGLAVFCTYGLQYFVCLEIVWSPLKDKFKTNRRLYEYIVRTILTTLTVLLAAAVPKIGPFIGLIGALCFSLLGLIIPVLIEIVTFWEVGFGPFNWVIWKNVLVILFGLAALVFGSWTALLDIATLYLPDEEITNAINATVANNMTSALDIVNSTISSIVNETISHA